MKIAFWSYVVGQGLLVGASIIGKLSIWVSLIPTFVLVSLSAGLMLILLMLEFMFNHIGDDDPFGLDKEDDDDEYEEDENNKDSTEK
jgi:hypothetical protein